jgi:hypothetical protein
MELHKMFPTKVKNKIFEYLKNRRLTWLTFNRRALRESLRLVRLKVSQP